MKTLRDFNLKNRRVLLRCDFNVPCNKEGRITDDFRIKQTIPTINYLIENGSKIILMSHLDDPKGKIVENLRLNFIQEKLMEYLDLSVTKAKDCIGKEIENWIGGMQPGEILLLENLRFHKEEEMGDLSFAKKLSELGDVYINDAFGVCHRAHASVVGIPKYLPSGIGFLLEKEIRILKGLMERPKKPLISIIGGKKVETKAKLIDRISEVSDFVLIGGLIEKEIREKKIKLKYPSKIIGPVAKAEGKDIGPQTISIFKEKIASAKTIFWNGPLGKIEEDRYSKGTAEIAKAIVESKAFSVVGGGETVEFINKLGIENKFNHLSTGGGAMLSFLSGEELPGLKVLEN